MSIISRIFHSYRESLHRSQERYENAYLNNARRALQFYQAFLNQLFIRYEKMFSNPHILNQIITKAELLIQSWRGGS